jgi:hypothetical protein
LNFWIAKVGLEEDAAFFVVLVLPRRRARARPRRAHTRPRGRRRPYSWSEVIHKPGSKALFLAFERERPRIVNNFAASALSGYEFSSSSEKDELTETFEPGGCCLSRRRILRLGRIVSETITSRYKEFASVSGRANAPCNPLTRKPSSYE